MLFIILFVPQANPRFHSENQRSPFWYANTYCQDAQHVLLSSLGAQPGEFRDWECVVPFVLLTRRIFAELRHDFAANPETCSSSNIKLFDYYLNALRGPFQL